MTEEPPTETLPTETLPTETLPTETPPSPAPAEDSWEAQRVAIADGDEKMLNYLNRFVAQKDVFEAALEARDKIASGEYKRNTEPPVDDEVAMKDWREANGIPESADKYTMPEGVVFSDNDKPLVDEFLANMHESNVPDSYTKPALEWYTKLQETQLAQEAELAKQDAVHTEEVLRAEWGADYLANRNEVENFLKTEFPEATAEILMSHPDTILPLTRIARQINPTVSLFPNSQNPNQSVNDEIASIEAKMHSDEYKNSDEMQDRYRALLTARGR